MSLRRREKSAGVLLTKVLVVFATFVFVVVGYRAVFYDPDTEIPVSGADSALERRGQKSLPMRLTIPALGIDADVQRVGINAEGNMANPSNFTDVAWYKYGSVPGAGGSAVIAGHVDNGLGLSGVFKKLSDIKSGDDIYVTAGDGTSARFEVVAVKSYPYKDVPIDVIFDESGASRLNLITCNGDWIKSDKTYDQRLVVSARLVP